MAALTVLQNTEKGKENLVQAQNPGQLITNPCFHRQIDVIQQNVSRKGLYQCTEAE